MTSVIDPETTGWASAVFPNPDSMVIFGGLIVLTQGSAVAPFIYTIF